MRSWISIGAGAVIVSSILIFFLTMQRHVSTPIHVLSRLMKIESSAFHHNDTLPSQYTCDGKGINPPLHIASIPEKTQSIVLIMDDPDAPGQTFDHWIVWNIPSAPQMDILEGETPKGVVGKNSAGGNAYFPPCPPSGQHRYFFKIFALDTLLDLPAGSPKAMLEKAIQGHILDSAELIGLYQRK